MLVSALWVGSQSLPWPLPILGGLLMQRMQASRAVRTRKHLPVWGSSKGGGWGWTVGVAGVDWGSSRG